MLAAWGVAALALAAALPVPPLTGPVSGGIGASARATVAKARSAAAGTARVIRT